MGALYFLLSWALDGERSGLVHLGIMLGAACAIKMQGVPLAGVLMVAALWRVIRQREAWREWALSAALIVILGGPWYLKTCLYTGNPFYPFGYEVFGGRYWSADRAQAYEYHQLNFGPGELPADIMDRPALARRVVGPRAPLKWLIGPVLVTVEPWEFSVNPALKAQALLADWVGPLYLPLIVLLLLFRRPRAVGWILWVFLPLWLWWFFSMQYTRYLLPTLVLVAPVAGLALARIMARGGVARTGGATVVTAWAGWALLPVLLTLYSAWPAITGAVAWDRYLEARLDVYPVARHIARYLPQDAVIATYGEPRSYGFERPVIWADRAHSGLIDYDSMDGPQELMERFEELGVTHVLINPIHSGMPSERRGPEMALLDDAIGAGLLEQIGLPGRHLLYRVAPDAARAGAQAPGTGVDRL
jgi:hypothetical protein